jgi:hypothetical protein
MSLKNYCTIEDIENYLLIEIDASFEGQIESWMEAIEKYVDRMTGRNFKAGTEATKRLYDGDKSRELFIDDCVEIESVKVDNENVDYYAYPANELPKIKIELKNDYFTRGKQNVSVMAKWGYSADVPGDIKFVCTVLMAGIINNAANTDGEVKSLSLGAYNITYKDQKQTGDYDNAMKILENYRRMTL